MASKASRDADENDDVYTMDSDDEPERAPQRQPKPAKPAKPTKVRQKPRRQQQKSNVVSEDNVQDEAKAVQPYERNRSTQLSNQEASPTQARGRIQKHPARQEEQVQKNKKDEDSGLKLRLDLNLDIEVDLKASIRGDLTLALLWVWPDSPLH